MSKKNPVAVVHEVSPERRRCGRLGRGKPGRKFRLTAAPGRVKPWARTTPEGLAWLARKAAS